MQWQGPRRSAFARRCATRRLSDQEAASAHSHRGTLHRARLGFVLGRSFCGPAIDMGSSTATISCKKKQEAQDCRGSQRWPMLFRRPGAVYSGEIEISRGSFKELCDLRAPMARNRPCASSHPHPPSAHFRCLSAAKSQLFCLMLLLSLSSSMAFITLRLSLHPRHCITPGQPGTANAMSCQCCVAARRPVRPTFNHPRPRVCILNSTLWRRFRYSKNNAPA